MFARELGDGRVEVDEGVACRGFWRYDGAKRSSKHVVNTQKIIECQRRKTTSPVQVGRKRRAMAKCKERKLAGS